MPHNGRFTDISGPTINDIHDEGLIHHFQDGIGRRLLALTPSFPFVFIGKILNVVDDHVVVGVESTTIADLEDRIWHIHIHNIEAFYIERDGGPCIPELDDNIC